MTPGARVAAAIEILDRIEAGLPAEKALTGWARGARFAGSKDRAAVRDHVFQVLRCWRSYACLGGAATGRGRMIGTLRAAGVDPDELFHGQGYAPQVLAAEERAAGQAPEAAADRLDMPDWLLAAFHESLGETAAPQAALDLRDRAPVMLRVNLRKTTLEAAGQALSDAGISTRPDGIAASALVLTEGARKLVRSPAFETGLVELQDGSSQAAMAWVNCPDGAKVLDYCAGGGGKSLALAARRDGRFFAHDAAPERMSDLAARSLRAGVTVTQLKTVQLGAEAPFDLVLCDVPCSGSGTWRRSPDAKWRLSAAMLDELIKTQAAILDSAISLCGHSGRIIYATCSVLRAENEAQIDAFLARHGDWRYEDSRRWPICESGDGFFVAELRRG